MSSHERQIMGDASQTMKILGEDVRTRFDRLSIYELKFLPENPRVYACTSGLPDFEVMTEEEQQDEIFKNLQKEPSVKNLQPDIERHGGLLESILVRHDTKHVIEGNSRLAVYRILDKKSHGEEWKYIPCQVVSKLSEVQQAALLNQIHVKGKTTWSAYEKANFSYVRHRAGWSVEEIAELFNEGIPTIRGRIDTIKLMESNGDTKQAHFSFYEVWVKSTKLSKAKEDDKLKSYILTKIREFGESEKENEFTALDLRDKLPVIVSKPKILKKFIKNDDVGLDDAFQLARISDIDRKIKQALAQVESITFIKVSKLNIQDLNAFRYSVSKLKKVVDRVANMVEKAKSK